MLQVYWGLKSGVLGTVKNAESGIIETQRWQFEGTLRVNTVQVHIEEGAVSGSQFPNPICGFAFERRRLRVKIKEYRSPALKW